MAEVQGPRPPVYGPEITTIQSELLKISKMLQSQSRSTHKQRPSPSPSGICWYHERFGSNAKKCPESCKFRETRPPVGDAVHTTGSSRLLHVFDKHSKLHFLIDTDAEIIFRRTSGPLSQTRRQITCCELFYY